MFVDVAFPISSYRVFTYQVPRPLEPNIVVGVRVRAPLGHRQAQGIVVAKYKKPPFTGRVKPLSSLVDEFPVLNEHLWKLLLWMSDYYLTPLGQVARAIIPASLTSRYQPPTRLMVRSDVAIDPSTEELVEKAPAQARVLRYLTQQKEAIPVARLKHLVANPTAVCRKLAAKGLVTLNVVEQLPDATGFTFQSVTREVCFNEDQQAVLEKLARGLTQGKFQPYLLHGVTGSGKTEIYIEVARKCLERGRRVILLLPEIALTPQIAGRFRAVFKDRVALWHSRLPHNIRAWTWKRIGAGDFDVVIGARSAVFCPVNNLGLIVLDEEQEQTYKQESPEPRYHAREVALVRGKLHRAVVVLSSATPSLESYYNHIQSKYVYLRLPERFGGAKYPHVHLVNMVQEQEETGKVDQLISGLLQDKIAQRLKRNEQVILLHNRRGFAPVYYCTQCGEMVMCQHCRVTLTYHRVGAALRCHFCGYTRPDLPLECRHCGSPHLRLRGTGTQKVEDHIQVTFPQARLARLDLDTTRSTRVLTRCLERFGRGEIDILVGTQMLAKGLDFDNATLVGIVNGDTGLFLPDFRASERVFQLIYQAAGRSGRRRKRGEVVIQTYNPDDPVIKYAAHLDLKTFYNILLSERRELNYPPFSWMVKLEFSGKKRALVSEVAEAVRRGLKGRYRGLEIIGPAFCYREKLRDRYRLQMLFKSSKEKDPNGTRLHRFLHQNFVASRNIPRSGIRLNIDVNPVSML